MPDETSAFVAEALRTRGFVVTLLPESDSKSADLLASKGDEAFVIEVKAKTDDPAQIQEVDSKLQAGQVVTEEHEVLPRNTIARVVRHGVKQLQASAQGDPIRLLWFMGMGARGRLYSDQIEKTLLGPTLLIDLLETSFQMQCYFFYESSFFRWRDRLDGAVVADSRGVTLCVNPFAPRAQRLRLSPLAHIFGSTVLDPSALEAEGEACIADCPLNRTQSYPVLQYLREKLGRRTLINVDMTYMRVSAALSVQNFAEAKR
jgi:hypothetical protein